MRTQKQIEANYTELIHAGEGITVEKGKISATGSGGSGGGGGVFYVSITGEGENLSIDKTSAEILSAINNNSVLIFDANGTLCYPASINVEGDTWGIELNELFMMEYTQGTKVVFLSYLFNIYDEGEGIVVEDNSIGEVTINLGR